MRNVEGAKAGSNQKKPYRAPVSVTSTQRMRIKYGISEGTIRGFSAEFSHNEMLKRIYLDGTPIMSAEGEQLLDVVVEFRDGSRDQEPINGLPSISVEHDVGVEVKLAAPVSRSFDRSDTTSYDVRISVPTLYRGDDEGNSEKGLIQFKIDVSTDGGAFEEAGRFDIYEKILNGYAETYNVVVPKGSNHVVRISRLNSEVVSDYSVNRLVVEAITENTDVRLRYTNTAVLYLEYDAEQFSNVPKLEMRVFGKNDILVPANYNGDTHAYATSGAGTTNGVWDGTWKRAYTDNPVWISLDLMISRRYGLGDKIDLTFINKWELYGLAQYCDEAVADGKGGFEPRFTCNNMYLQKSEDAYRVLKDLAASFRAKVVWDGEFITLQADVPRDPVHTFSNANASDITYSSTQDSAQRNLINVQYYDRDNKFASDVVMQRSNSNILSRGKVVDGNFTALGCASQGQAQRIASYVMNTELYETELVSFTTGLEGGLVRLNDVIQMADNSVAGQTVGGRIAAVNGRSITLDRKIPDNVQAIATTQLSINRQDVKNEPISIVSISDDRMTAVLASDAPAGTEAGLVWALLTQDLVPQKFVVTDIEFDSTNMTFALSAIQYNESKYAAIDGSARIVVPPISVTEYKMLKAPIIVIASYLTRIIQDAVVCDIDVSWAQSTNAVQYQLEMQKAGSDWRIVGRFMSLATTLDNMYTGTYTFRVCAYDSLGNASQYTYSDPILVAGKVLPPPALAQYSVIGILFGYQHKWIYPAHTEDSRAVRLRFTTIDPVASPSQEWQYIDVAYPTANFTEQDVSANLRTWFSAAIVDKYGNVGAYTEWQSVVPSVDATQVLDLLDGQLTAQQLDQDLIAKIAIGAEAAEAAESAQTAADAAAQAAANAQTAANGASVAASNAQTAATNAQTTASNAQTAATTAQTAATTAMTAASNAQTSANDAAAAVNDLAAEVDADITALSTDLNTKLTTLGNGLTQETTDRQNADTQIVGQLNAYKTSNDAAVAGVLQKAEAATTASTANAQALTSLTTTVNTKNRTYRQATAPTTGRVIGDLWINTTAGKNNEVRRWNGTAWDDLTDPRTAANATALTNLQTTVTAIDGRTTANANSITQLSTDLTTLSNNVNAKADASAVDSLTTRVSTAEGDITSQGTRVTNLENSVNHATTGLASKASSSALTAVDNKVTAANGRIDTTNSNVTTLTGRVSTVEGAVATKAEAAALTALTTRVTNAEGVNTSQGTAITTLQNTVNHATTGLSTKASSAALTTLDNKVTAIDGRVTSNSSSITSLNNSLTTTNTNVTAAQTAATNAMTAAGQKGKVIFGTTAPVAADQLSQNLWIDTTGDANTPKRWNGTAWVVVTDKVATDALAAANAASSLAATKADSSALTALDSKVTTIDGKVTTNASNITTLQGKVTTVENGLATKADGSALSALTTRVTTAEGVNTSQGTQIDAHSTQLTSLNNSITSINSALSTKADSSALTTLESKVTANTNNITAQGTQLTQLGNRVTTVENGLTTKADAVALTNLATRVTATENGLTTQATQITKLKADLSSGGAVNLGSAAFTDPQVLIPMFNGGHTPSLVASELRTNGKAYNIRNSTSGGGNYIYMGVFNNNSEWRNAPLRVRTGKRYLISAYMKSDATPAQVSMQLRVFAGDGVTTATLTGALVTTGSPTTYAALTDQLVKYTWAFPTVGLANAQTATLLFRGNLLGTTPINTNIMIDNIMFEELNGDPVEGSPYVAGSPDIFALTQADTVNANAITTTNAEVSRINGVVVAQGTSITNLQAGLTTTNNNIATKADGSALTALTTRVTNAEGVNTSQGSAITTLQNTVNHATTGLATKAATSALNTLDSKVTGIDGRVTANATSITDLQSGLTTANNNIATKADSSALSALTTRVTNAEGSITNQSSSITNLISTLDVAATASSNLLANSNIEKPYNADGAYPHGKYDLGVPWEVGATYTLLWCATHQRAAGDTSSYVAAYMGGGSQMVSSITNGDRVIKKQTFVKSASGTSPLINLYLISKPANGVATTATVHWAVLVKGDKLLAAEWIPSSFDYKSDVATKADASALNTLNTTVSNLNGTVTSQGTRLTTLENSVNSTANGLATKASSTALSTLDNKVTGIDGRVTANATQLTQLNSSLTTTNNNVTAAQNAADAAASLAGSKGKVLVQTAAPIVADRLVQNLWIDITGNANTPKRWNGSAWVAVTDKVATDAAAAAANALSVAQTKADASALTSLTTRVDTIDGKVTAQATQLSSLSTTVGNHTASITSQQTSIDGLSAKATIQVAAGNTIGGVSLGNNGGVVDFIVRADTFAVAPPVSAGAGNAGKYAFNYRATPTTLPNGTVVAAGLYLNNLIVDYIDASKIYAESLSAVSATIGVLRTASAGSRMEIRDNVIKCYDGDTLRVQLGNLEL